MFSRQRTGSVVCPSCGNLVGVNDERCYNCGRWNPGLWGYAPLLRRLGHDLGFTSIVIGGCTVLYLLTLLATVALGGRVRLNGVFDFMGPDESVLLVFGGSGSVPVFRLGRWWTVLSAGWLHAGVLHILFNMMWVRQLAPAVAECYGASRAVIIYTIAGVLGFALSSLFGALLPGVPILGGGRLTVGASAPIFGLLGALVRYGHRTGSSHIGSQAWSFALAMFIFGIIMPGVDNWAHGGGFVGGYLAGFVLDPLQRERPRHLFVALACLALTAMAVLASLVSALDFVRG